VNIKTTNVVYHSFSSRVLKGGNLFRPERVVFEGEYLVFHQRSLLSGKKYSVTLRLKDITSVEKIKKSSGYILIIRGKSQTVFCRGLSGRQVSQIMERIREHS
jgi:hypothetical protein